MTSRLEDRPAVTFWLWLGTVTAVFTGLFMLPGFRSHGSAWPTPAEWVMGSVASALGLAGVVLLGIRTVRALRRKGRRVRGFLVGLVVFPLLLVSLLSALGWVGHALRDRQAHEAWVSRRQDLREVHVLTLLHSEARMEPGFPGDHLGKDAILALVAHGVIDPRRRANLRDLFPGDSDERIPPSDAYAELTAETLGTRDFSHLTGYAGPGEPLTLDREAMGVPMFGAVVANRAAVVGFSDGSARLLDREALGLGLNDPIVIGPESKSPILRQLSNHSGPMSNSPSDD